MLADDVAGGEPANTSRPEILRASVGFPGDVDMVATIALAAASRAADIDHDIPGAAGTGKWPVRPLGVVGQLQSRSPNAISKSG